MWVRHKNDSSRFIDASDLYSFLQSLQGSYSLINLPDTQEPASFFCSCTGCQNGRRV
uniref:Uncharacterized protein n=1 Tax=Picea sitchensis TaxID=3332 RepID=A9P0M4_PICSI|nr:unknown [Picea sitchensis]